jgi:hypothetical protein
MTIELGPLIMGALGEHRQDIHTALRIKDLVP